jgi:hypothetical protein
MCEEAATGRNRNFNEGIERYERDDPSVFGSPKMAIEDELGSRLSLSRLSKIAVMVKSLVYLIIRDSQAHKFSK